MNAVPAWMVMIILGREFAVTGLRNIAALRGVLIPASGMGKAKMASQVVAIFLLLLSRRYPVLEPVGLLALWLAVALALLSGIRYFHRFWRDYYRANGRPSAATSQPAA
jgi:CDP-diacylglycerol--glycerol-3-phosphate 3-phosphatidyltransferase